MNSQRDRQEKKQLCTLSSFVAMHSAHTQGGLGYHKMLVSSNTKKGNITIIKQLKLVLAYKLARMKVKTRHE